MQEWSTLKKLIWLRMAIGGGSSWGWATESGASPLSLVNSIAHSIRSLTQYGKCVQDGTPTPSSPVNIMCNNGEIKVSLNMADVNADTVLVGYYISAQGVVTADANNWIYQNYIPVKPNTTYTLSMSAPVYYVSISEYSTADDSGFIIRKAGSTGSNTSLTITTGDTTNYIRFGANLDRAEVTLERVLAINWMLNIGDTAMDYQPYVEDGIYTDGTDEVLTVRGENLIDYTFCQNRTKNGITTTRNSDGSITLTGTSDGGYRYWNASDTMNLVLPAGTYQLSEHIELDSADGDCRGTFTLAEERTFINAYFLGFGKGETVNVTLYPLLTVASTVQTVTNIPMLLSVGDVKDELELISGNADRAITVFRVSPDMNWALATGTGFKQFYTTDTQGQLKNSVSCMSNIAPYGCTASNRASYQHGCYTGGTGNLCFQMIGEANINTVDDWKDFLRANGVYVVAAKATETTEQVTPQPLHTAEGTTVISVESNVDPVTLEAEYAKVPSRGIMNTLLGTKYTKGQVSAQKAEQIVNVIIGEEER